MSAPTPGATCYLRRRDYTLTCCPLHDAARETAAERDRLKAINADLLAALEELVLAFHGLPIRPEDTSDPVERLALDQARAAIRRARGET